MNHDVQRQPAAVVFDAVGTLINPDPPVAVAYGQAGRRHVSRLTNDECATRFHHAFAAEEAIDRDQFGWRTDELRERTRWRAIVERVFDDVADGDALFEELWNHFADPKHWRLIEGAAETWQALEARGVTLAIASNFDARLEAICRGLPPLQTCEHVFASSRLGVRKPSPDFFRRVGDELEVEPARLMMVGDDFDNDYRAATAAGWSALLFDPLAKNTAEVPTLRSLRHLNALFTPGG